jgi:hypothetical protein
LELAAAESSPSVAESRAEDTIPTATRAEAVLSSPAAVRGQAGILLICFHAPAHLLEFLRLQRHDVIVLILDLAGAGAEAALS